MKSKKALLFGLIPIVLIIGIVIFIIAKPSKQIYKEPGIFLPAEGGFVEAWEPLIAEINKELNIEDLCIRTYSSAEELEDAFKNPEIYNILWAEVPVTGEYDFGGLVKKDCLKPIDNLKKEYYTPSLFNAIQNLFLTDNEKVKPNQQTYYALPYSCDFWLYMKKKNAKTEKTTNQYAIPGKDMESAFAVLADFYPVGQDTSKKTDLKRQGLIKLDEYSNNGTFQKNPFTYNKLDARQMVLDEVAKYTSISMSEFITFSVEERALYEITPIKEKLIANATVILFANAKDEKMQNYVSSFQKALDNPFIIFNSANSRNWQPIRIDTVSRNIQADNLRKSARLIKTCTMPWLNYASPTEKQALFDEIKRVLSTRIK